MALAPRDEAMSLFFLHSYPAASFSVSILLMNKFRLAQLKKKKKSFNNKKKTLNNKKKKSFNKKKKKFRLATRRTGKDCSTEPIHLKLTSTLLVIY